MSHVDRQARNGRRRGTRISYASDGEAVSALLYEPQSPRASSPAIVVSPSRASTIAEMSWLSKPLVDAGYSVLVQGYRAGAVRYQVRDVADVRNAVSYLVERGKGNPDRIAVVGHSRGGSASLRAAAEDGRIKSTIALSPPIDVARYMNALREHSPSRFAKLAEGYGARPEDDPRYYRQISPLFHASNITTPVLLIHGTDDMVAPMENSKWMHAALLRNANSNARLELIPEAGHFFEHRFNGYLFEPVLDLVLGWLSQTIDDEASLGDAGM